MKKWLIRGVIAFGGILALLAATLALTPRVDALRQRVANEKQAKRDAARKQWEEGWRKWWDENQSVDNGGKQPSKKGQRPAAPAGWDKGFTAGYLVGASKASRVGGLQPPSAEVTELAQAAAEEAGTPAGERQAWVSGFTAGFGFGWKEGRP